ncbi:MAG: hypothetical protein F2585_10140 [Actinobacteria bacterium]|nr:hypothetical protein [Actinomycetota bacterium]
MTLPTAPQPQQSDLDHPALHRRLLSTPATRSGLRFAITIVAVDLIARALFGESSAALLASLAVCIHLYFLDFDGDFRERFVGQGIATLVGAVAVLIGVLCSSPLWLAVIVTIVVSSSFAYLRLLRGYVSRSAVGLQGAFFLPLMITANLGDAPSLLGGWFLGSSVSIVAALVVLPHRRSGLVRRLLADWLRAGAELSDAVGSGEDLATSVKTLEDSRDALLSQVTTSFSQPGAVGHRQRALASMVAGARWSMPLVERLTSRYPTDAGTLAELSADGFRAAADLVGGGALTADLPDIPAERTRDLDALATQGPEVLGSHYPVRLLSIGAMNQLYQAALSRRCTAPVPDVGHFATTKPSAILRANLRWNSLWLQNALRTGFGAAACVLIVRVVGIDHGLWVVLAALAVTQVSLSGAAGATTMVMIVAGATGGVLVAGLLAMLHLPYPVFVCALPVAAFVARRVAGSNMALAQMTYTQFALINFAVLAWPPHKGLEVVRFQDILLGAAVAAGFSVLAFPTGVSKLLRSLRSKAVDSAQGYLTGNIAAMLAGVAEPNSMRAALLDDLDAYENALDAAFMHERKRTAELMEHEIALTTARDLLIGGDACAELELLAQADPKLRPIACELAEWWGNFTPSGSVDLEPPTF